MWKVRKEEKMKKRESKINKIIAVIKINDYFEEMKETCEKMLSMGKKELRKLRAKN